MRTSQNAFQTTLRPSRKPDPVWALGDSRPASPDDLGKTLSRICRVAWNWQWIVVWRTLAKSHRSNINLKTRQALCSSLYHQSVESLRATRINSSTPATSSDPSSTRHTPTHCHRARRCSKGKRPHFCRRSRSTAMCITKEC